METMTIGSKKFLSNVLVKQVLGGFPDKVLFIDNLPFELIYHMQYPMVVVGEGRSAYWGADASKEKVPTLKPGIEASQIDDGVVFNLDRGESKDRLDEVLRYINSVWPREKALPEFEFASMDPGQPNSPMRPYAQFPRAVLPLLSPVDQTMKGDQPSALSTLSLAQLKEELKKEILEETEKQKLEAARERAAKAREARHPKKDELAAEEQ